MIEYFKPQLDTYPKITQGILDKIEYKRVWSGKMIGAGDVVVYAYIYEKNTDDLKLISFLGRELNELSKDFKFIKMSTIPILAFADDKTKRE